MDCVGRWVMFCLHDLMSRALFQNSYPWPLLTPAACYISCVFVLTHTYTHTRTHARTHARTHTRTHACAHTHTHKHALTHTHTPQAEVKAVFGSGKNKVAGCVVTQGKLQRAFVSVKRGKQVCVYVCVCVRACVHVHVFFFKRVQARAHEKPFVSQGSCSKCLSLML